MSIYLTFTALNFFDYRTVKFVSALQLALILGVKALENQIYKNTENDCLTMQVCARMYKSIGWELNLHPCVYSRRKSDAPNYDGVKSILEKNCY